MSQTVGREHRHSGLPGLRLAVIAILAVAATLLGLVAMHAGTAGQATSAVSAVSSEHASAHSADLTRGSTRTQAIDPACLVSCGEAGHAIDCMARGQVCTSVGTLQPVVPLASFPALHKSLLASARAATTVPHEDAARPFHGPTLIELSISRT